MKQTDDLLAVRRLQLNPPAIGGTPALAVRLARRHRRLLGADPRGFLASYFGRKSVAGDLPAYSGSLVFRMLGGARQTVSYTWLLQPTLAFTINQLFQHFEFWLQQTATTQMIAASVRPTLLGGAPSATGLPFLRTPAAHEARAALQSYERRLQSFFRDPSAQQLLATPGQAGERGPYAPQPIFRWVTLAAGGWRDAAQLAHPGQPAFDLPADSSTTRSTQMRMGERPGPFLAGIRELWQPTPLLDRQWLVRAIRMATDASLGHVPVVSPLRQWDRPGFPAGENMDALSHDFRWVMLTAKPKAAATQLMPLPGRLVMLLARQPFAPEWRPAQLNPDILPASILPPQFTPGALPGRIHPPVQTGFAGSPMLPWPGLVHAGGRRGRDRTAGTAARGAVPYLATARPAGPMVPNRLLTAAWPRVAAESTQPVGGRQEGMRRQPEAPPLTLSMKMFQQAWVERLTRVVVNERLVAIGVPAPGQPGAMGVQTVLPHPFGRADMDVPAFPARTFAAMLNQKLAANVPMPARDGHDAPGWTAPRLESAFVRPPGRLELPALSYVFTQPVRHSVAEEQIITTVLKKEVVESVQREMQTVMSSRSFPLHLSRADYEQITDRLHSSLARQLLVEKERRGMNY